MTDRTEDILTSILNMAAEGVIVTDGELRILVFSGGAETIFGYAANEIIGRSIEVLIPESARVRHREHVARFKEKSATSLRMRGRLQTMGVSRSGAAVPIEVDLSRLTAPRGEIITAIVRDVTERAEAERSLAAAANKDGPHQNCNHECIRRIDRPTGCSGNRCHHGVDQSRPVPDRRQGRRQGLATASIGFFDSAEFNNGSGGRFPL